MKRRALVFSALGLVGFLVLLALFEQGTFDVARTDARYLLDRVRTATDGVGWAQLPGFVAMGVGAGFFAGMLGMGGGVLKVAGMLLLFRLDVYFARDVSVVTMFFSTVSGLVPHWRERRVLWELAGPMAGVAVAGVVFGVLVGNHVGGPALTHLFGFFVIFLGLNTLALVFADPGEHEMTTSFRAEGDERRRGILSGVVGGLHGFLCGLLGISGGVVAIPMQQLLVHVPVRNAIANTLLVSAVSTGLASGLVVLLGVTRGHYALSQLLMVIAAMGGGAAVGAQLGARAGRRVSPAVLRLLFVALALTAGVSILF
ncbi:MAG: hypothetical protein Kow0092_37280 [Deferrisomatales bacterium]